jgi:hypothetical protein
MEKIKYGFSPDTIKQDQYVLGSGQLGYKTLVPDGQWDEYLPEDEIQKKYGVETMSCVSFGTLNCVEILFKRIFNVNINYSDRALAIMSQTTRTGNSPHKVAETLRKQGTFDENYLPFTSSVESFDDYHSGLTKEHILRAENWLDSFNFGHDWVFTGGSIKDKQILIKNALKSSPIGVSVDAWKKKDGYYVKDKGAKDNHWCTCYGYKEGKYWKIFDHYNNTKKKLAWDYDFGYAKRFTVEKKRPQKSYEFFNELFQLFKEMFLKLIKDPLIDQSKKKEIVSESIKRLSLIKDDMEKEQKTAKECLLQLAKDNLGRDVTPDDVVSDEVACAEVVSTIIKKVAPDFPIIPHTMNLYKALKNSPTFEGTLDLEPGNIIISPTGHWKSNGVIRGHVGIILENGQIASNTSATGKWESNYTITSWVRRYRGIGNYPLFVFKMVDKDYRLGGLVYRLQNNIKSVI